MSKYISKTKSKIIFREIAEKEIENLKQGDPMSNKILADIIARREALRARQAQRSSEKQRMLDAIHNHQASVHAAPQPKLDEFEKEYEAFIAEQRRLKEEREAKEAAEKETTKIPVITFIEKDDPVKEVKDDVISEEDTTSENSEEVQVVETKPKKKSKKKKVVEATETVE
jgi:hypothetical protein